MNASSGSIVCQSLIECKLENAVQLLYLSSWTEDDWQLHDAAMTGFINTLHLEPRRVGVSEEYIDNFNRSQQNPQSNYRSMVSPGLQVLLDYGFLTGSAAYTLDAFYDSLAKTPGFPQIRVGILK